MFLKRIFPKPDSRIETVKPKHKKQIMESLKKLFGVCLIFTLLIGCNNQQDDHTHAEEANKESHEEIRTQTVAGTVSGFDCAVVGVLCPSTHRGADYTNGLFTEGEEFYFVVNIPQSYLRQYFLDDLEVTGKVYPNYHSAVEPVEIYLLKEDEKKLVYESGYFIDPQGHRALFNEGKLVEGVWLCANCAEER